MISAFKDVIGQNVRDAFFKDLWSVWYSLMHHRNLEVVGAWSVVGLHPTNLEYRELDVPITVLWIIGIAEPSDQLRVTCNGLIWWHLVPSLFSSDQKRMRGCSNAVEATVWLRWSRRRRGDYTFGGYQSKSWSRVLQQPVHEDETLRRLMRHTPGKKHFSRLNLSSTTSSL